MDPTAQLCSHRLHSVAMFGRRSHCPAAPAGPLLVVIGTVDCGQYIYLYGFLECDGNRRKRKQNQLVRLERQKAGWAYFSVLCQINL